MCGIAAIVDGAYPGSADTINRMVAALRHRGPDAQSSCLLNGAQLGHARLSIIDLAGGDQPMTDVSKRWWIVFNGELYNYRELRKELLGLDVPFRTQSDTEVVLGAYRTWGPRCLDRFRGMYAFVVWDDVERRLFAARDIFGEKPLYFARGEDQSLLIASEIKSILASGRLSPALDHRAVDSYLSLGYVLPDRTIYSNVRALAPGHYFDFRAGGEPRPICYWKPRPDPRAVSITEAEERLRTLLEQAVRRQMVADVPVGAFLSGGHDSSTIVALMAQQVQRPVKTFSVGFGERINELPYARDVAKMYRTEHHEVDLGAPPVAALLERMAEVYDEPFMDPSHIPTYLIAEYARRSVKVVLTGDGADELFGGYAWYRLLAASVEVSGATLPWLVTRSISRALCDRVAPLALHSQARGLARRWPDVWERYVRYRVGLADAERSALWRRPVERSEWLGSYYRPGEEVRGMDRALYFDLLAFLPGDILVKVDRAAMAHGLETRAPFLDRDVVEFALTLPAALKVTRTQTKILFKAALRPLWPDSLHHRGKQGFAAPHEQWLGRADVQALVRRVFARGSALRELLPGITPDHASGVGYRTWNFLTLGLWLERHAAQPNYGDASEGRRTRRLQHALA